MYIDAPFSLSIGQCRTVSDSDRRYSLGKGANLVLERSVKIEVLEYTY